MSDFPDAESLKKTVTSYHETLKALQEKLVRVRTQTPEVYNKTKTRVFAGYVRAQVKEYHEKLCALEKVSTPSKEQTEVMTLLGQVVGLLDACMALENAIKSETDDKERALRPKAPEAGQSNQKTTVEQVPMVSAAVPEPPLSLPVRMKPSGAGNSSAPDPSTAQSKTEAPRRSLPANSSLPTTSSVDTGLARKHRGQGPRVINNNDSEAQAGSAAGKHEFIRGSDPEGYYHRLGLDPLQEYTTAQIKKTQKKLSVTMHPDKHPGNLEAHDRFTDMMQAAQFLVIPANKQAYDEEGLL